MPAPSAVRSISLSIDTTNNLNRVTLSWQSPASNGGKIIRNYIVQFKIGLNGIWTDVTASKSPKTGFPTNANTRMITHTFGTNPGAINKNIYYRVGARNDDGVILTLAPNFVTPSSNTPNTPMITGLVSNSAGQASVTLRPATVTAPILSYNVYYWVANVGSDFGSVTAPYAGETTTVTVNNLIPGATYQFSAAALNNFGASATTPISDPLLIRSGPPAPPTDVSVKTRVVIQPENYVDFPISQMIKKYGLYISWSKRAGSQVTGWKVAIRESGLNSPWTIRDVPDTSAGSSLLGENQRQIYWYLEDFPIRSQLPSIDRTYEIKVAPIVDSEVGNYSTTVVHNYMINPLFNRAGLANKGIPAKHLTLINNAMDKWETYLTYPTSTFLTLKQAISQEIQNYDWNGIDIISYSSYNDPNISTLATASMNTSVISSNTNNRICYSVFGTLSHNLALDNSKSDWYWERVWTHELGHLLGIGFGWNTAYCGNGVTPINNFLDGSKYPNTQKAYNDLVWRPNLKYVPLESSGGPGSADGHWENNYRIVFNGPVPIYGYTEYPGFANELMNGANRETNVLSMMSIKALTDLGYVEYLPGNAEGYSRVNYTPTAELLDNEPRCGGVTPLTLEEVKKIIYNQ